MPEAEDPRTRRDLITKLLPYVALSAIKVGVSATPLSLLSNAAARYNEGVERTKEKVKDLLPLIPGIEKLNVEVKAPNTVSMVLQRADVRNLAEQYLLKVLALEGASGAPSGKPSPSGDESAFDYVLRLPSRNVYMKAVGNVTQAEIAHFLEVAQKLKPADVWIFADRGAPVDVRLEPVFVSENLVRRGRLKSVTTAAMLLELFDRKFEVTTETRSGDSIAVSLRLTS